MAQSAVGPKGGEETLIGKGGLSRPRCRPVRGGGRAAVRGAVTGRGGLGRLVRRRHLPGSRRRAAPECRARRSDGEGGPVREGLAVDDATRAAGVFLHCGESQCLAAGRLGFAASPSSNSFYAGLRAKTESEAARPLQNETASPISNRRGGADA